jgi:ribosome biogenesis protein ENP2
LITSDKKIIKFWN